MTIRQSELLEAGYIVPYAKIPSLRGRLQSRVVNPGFNKMSLEWVGAPPGLSSRNSGQWLESATV